MNLANPTKNRYGTSVPRTRSARRSQHFAASSDRNPPLKSWVWLSTLVQNSPENHVINGHNPYSYIWLYRLLPWGQKTSNNPTYRGISPHLQLVFGPILWLGSGMMDEKSGAPKKFQSPKSTLKPWGKNKHLTP